MYQRCPSIALDGLNPCIFGMNSCALMCELIMCCLQGNVTNGH